MQLDTLHLPINWQKIQTHSLANKVGKRWISGNNLPQSIPTYGQICQDCGRRATHCPKFKFCQSTSSMQQRYGYYGPNCVIYLGFIKYIIYFMAICSIIFCIPMFVLNLVGKYCKQKQNNCNALSIIYYWSVYNVIGDNSGSLPHHVLWLIFTFGMILFTLYLRKYSMQLYRKINNKNQTDSDFCLIFRRLPDDTVQDDIRKMIQHQISTKYQNGQIVSQKTLQELKKIQVKDVMMIYKFKQLLKINDKNVKYFKKFMQNKNESQCQNFIPNPLPQVTQFANAAIIRFYTNQYPSLIIKTIQWKWYQKLINYLFPFYHPCSQYQINNQLISIQSAPEPNDIQWENFGFTEILRIGRKIICSLLAVLLLIISAGFSISFSLWIESLLKTTHAQPTLLTIIISAIMLLYGVILQLIISFIIKIIYLDTYTDQHCQQLFITVISQAINLGFFSIFGPIIAKLPSFIHLDTSGSSSFPLVMFTTILMQSFIGTLSSFFIQYYQLTNHLFKFLHQRGIFINTQTQAFKKYKGPQVPFVSGYGHNVIIVWYSFLCGVVSPICVPIGLIGMVLYYYCQKILFNSIYSIPVYGGPRLNSAMIDLLDYLPFLIGLFNFLLYTNTQSLQNFPTDNRILGIIITNIVIGGIHAIFPWRPLIHHFYDEKQSIDIANFDRNKLQSTYEKCYPASKPGVDVIIKPLLEHPQGQSTQKIFDKQKYKKYFIHVVKQKHEDVVEQLKNQCCKNL